MPKCHLPAEQQRDDICPLCGDDLDAYGCPTCDEEEYYDDLPDEDDYYEDRYYD